MTIKPKPDADEHGLDRKSELPSRKVDSETSADDEIDRMIRENIAREGP